ncbi:uncharacterized protein LOC123226665 isoform X2 [Mangifera indica]|uniref:uncharacterized protein LOC123226665 isoform X2 n=1 Tax=Mangifera indica TaxID=29780 RepID=UPI001CF9366A|nr:uncharacterized protein LOC123226665 isoform X2 [Mangifera indica]XP_044507114.1 uncharacterized protein LOC123226665 isoform X2 [Mangifera indica]XP_044507115.1 uncharacterized protein LOC123226665 isoform X2 [Mangifera indica]XP_044507116.1 uncharacterized protein LOC123226665 isoform X2 [Mangifera indica]
MFKTKRLCSRRFLVAAAGLQSLLSLSLVIVHIYALLMMQSLQNNRIVTLFAIGDEITSTLTFAAACVHLREMKIGESIEHFPESFVSNLGAGKDEGCDHACFVRTCALVVLISDYISCAQCCKSCTQTVTCYSYTNFLCPVLGLVHQFLNSVQHLHKNGHNRNS